MKNTLTDLNDALFAELEELQNDENFKNADGKIDEEKARLAVERADRIMDVADKIIRIQNLVTVRSEILMKYGYTPEKEEIKTLLLER